MSCSHHNTRELLHELARTGSPVDLSVLNRPHEELGLELEQVGGIYDSKAFALEDGRIGVMVNLAITNRKVRSIEVADVELHSSLVDSAFEWLTSSESRIRVKGRYCNHRWYGFPGRCSLELPYGQVLNHVLFEQRRLRGRHTTEGWLLGVGGVMTAAAKHGELQEVKIAINAIGYGEYVETFYLWTERFQNLRKVAKPTSRLFEPAEPQPEIYRPALPEVSRNREIKRRKGADEVQRSHPEEQAWGDQFSASASLSGCSRNVR